MYFCNVSFNGSIHIYGNVYQYSIIAMDESWLLAEKGFSVEVKGANSPPNIIPEEIEILFDPSGTPISDITSLYAYDPDDDSLTWSLVGEGKQPLWGTALVEGMAVNQAGSVIFQSPSKLKRINFG